MNERPVSGSTFFKMDSIVKKARQMLEHGFGEAGIDLTADQWVLVERLSNTGVISQNQLAQDSFKDAGTTTRILDLLCKKGYALRLAATHDRRCFDVSLTEKGKEVFEKARQQSLKVRSKGFGTLCEQDFKILNNLLDAIYVQMIGNM